VLESEPHGDFPPLLARWDDRVVFSFPLLVVLQRLNLPPAGVEIRPGKFLRLSSDGPVVPIDEYGQLARSLRPLAPYKEISAEALIDGGDELFPKHAPDPVILRDDRSAAEPATRAFSKSLAAVIAAVASEGGMSDARTYPRLRLGGEVGVMAGAVLVLTALCGLAVFRRNVAALVMVLVVVSAQWIGFSAGVWLPALPVLGGVAAMLLVSPLFKQRVRVLAEASPEREKVAVVELPPLREAVEEDTWESRPENFPAAVVQPLAEEEWSYQPTVKAPEPPPVSTVDDEWVYRPEDFRHNAPLVDDSWLYHTAEAVPEIEPEPEAEPTTRPVQPAPAVSVEPKPHGRSHREPVKKTAANKAPAKKDQKQAGKSRKPRRGKPPFSGS
jgi:hypothetical protein